MGFVLGEWKGLKYFLKNILEFSRRREGVTPLGGCTTWGRWK
jgi:hypothetical protein